MKSYYRVMLGKRSTHATECFEGSFIGADYGIQQDLTGKLPEEWRDFNKEFIPIYLDRNPDKSKVAAGLACGALWTITKGMQTGDIVLCPDGEGRYYVGEITGGYHHRQDGVLPHRRSVRWLDRKIDRSHMSQGLQNSTGSAGTVSNITKHAEEIEQLLVGVPASVPVSVDAAVEDPSAFAMEKHLEDFLIRNWAQSELAQEYDIFEEDGELVGQQYPTDTGSIDILAISKDKNILLVIELKKGRASDVAIGQILRYMGYVKEQLAEESQQVRGIVIALEDDLRLRRALVMMPHVDFYRYQISFKLLKA